MSDRIVHRYSHVNGGGALCESAQWRPNTQSAEEVTCKRCLFLMSWKWPCSRTEAHGPHPDVEWMGADPPECPGVAAHPLTMIGGVAQ